VAVIALAAAAALAGSAPAAAPAAESAPAKDWCVHGNGLQFRAADGTRLAGARWGKGRTAVVLAHQSSGDLCEWSGYAKRLARLGYLATHKEPRQTRQRTVYTLTGKGLHALALWAQTPVHFTALKSEALVRLLIADLVGEAATRTSMITLRDDLADLLARLDEIEATAHGLPHRRRYLLLVTGFMRRLFELHLDLVDEVERELDPAMRGGWRRASAGN
jgi:DNA-binding PadR family transcriptional regulator